MNDFKECLTLLIKSEGGFSDSNGDPGGATKYGVTRETWEEWVGHPVSVKDMENLTIEQVSPLYEQRYWKCCDLLPRGLNFLVFSMGVNAGSGRAIKLLQSCLGLVPDGIIGERVSAKIKESNVADLIVKYSQSRRDYYRSLKLFPLWGHGWLERVDNEEKEALQMVKSC
jgi:lysozyme family protein